MTITHDDEMFTKNTTTVRFEDKIHLAVWGGIALNKHKGTGTFDCVYDTNKYSTIEQAELANDYVEGNWSEIDGKKCIISHHISTPDIKSVHILNFQHIPCGIDVLDDSLAIEMMQKQLIK